MNSSIVRTKRSLLVTGGLGFIGLSLVRKLHQDFDIVVLDWKDRLEAKSELSELTRLGANFHRGDIADPEVWQRIEKCDFVFHGAAQVSAITSGLDPVRDFKSNAFGTFLVAEYARRHSARVIYCNSIRIYDTDAVEVAIRERGAVSEACATIVQSRKPQPPFAISKYIGEECLLSYARMHSLPVISFRMSGITGPGQIGSKVHGWISHLIGCAVNGITFTVYGSGKQSRDVLHISDYLELIEIALNKFDYLSGEGGAVYNVGGGPSNELSIEQVAHMLREEHRLDLNLVYEDCRMSEPTHYVSDCTLIASKGWQPTQTDPQSLISEIVDWYKKRRRNDNRIS
ncbi:MAG TPA: NAD-dependent epimerase/dehydratase family protein [Blastocatellia bacterium]|nr:NAD-dependent epimerase/dehydratase family protein [Blastocatellia bacterium]